MGRGRGTTGKSSSSRKTKKKGLSCPDGACYLSSDSDTACSDSDCSDCYECTARGSRRGGRGQAKSTTKSKSKITKPKTNKKKTMKKSKRRTRDSSTSCSCSDCMDYSSDDSYNCPPTRGRKCSTC